MSRKFGWHSGTLECQDIKAKGDVYIQDDLVFSDVSAGTLGVTGGIDMTGTTSAIGLNFTGGSFTTGSIMCGTGTSARQTMAEAEDFVLGIYTTCADTDGANTAKPLYVNAQYSGAGQVARAAEFVLYPTAKLGGWANALKAYTDFSGDNDGGTTGLASSACLEMKLPNGACNGAFYPLEIEWVGQASTAFGAPGTGTQSGLIYIGCTGTVTDFDSDGVFMSINGLTAGSSKLLSTNSQTLKVDLDNGSTTRYLVLSQATDSLSLAGATPITLVDSGATIAAAAASSTFSGGGTTGDALILAGSSADAGQKITITGASGTNVTGNLTIDGAGTFTTGTGDISILGDATWGTNKKAEFRDSAIYIYSSADTKLDLVADGTITLAVPGSGSGGIVFGGETDWGTGATGPDLDGTGYDWVTQTVGRVNTANITASAYAGAYTAFTLTASQNLTSSFFGTWTELYISASVTLTGASNVAAVWGQVECGASVTGPDQSDGDFMAAGYFNFITGASFTTGGYVNGVRIQSEISNSTFTASASTYTAGLEILTKSGSYQPWTYGVVLTGCTTGIQMNDVGATGEHVIDMADGYLGSFIETGSYASSADSGITLSDSNTRPVSFLFDDSAAALTGNNRAVLSRVYLAESQGAGSTIVSIQGQLKMADGKDFSAGRFCGVDGYMEFGGDTTVATGTYVSAMNARIDVADTKTVTVSSGGFVCGIHVHTTGTGTLTSTGSSYGIYINDQGTVDDWKVGLGITNSTTGIAVTNGTTGINITGTGGTATAKALTTSGWTINNAALTDGYGAVEVDLTLTGTSAGHNAALSSWITFGDVITGANYHVAQSNGLYSGASSVLTNGLFVFGMRMQCLLQTNNGASGATFFPFSIVNNTNVTTALFHTDGPANDIGLVTNGGSDTGTLVPLYYSGGTKYYVKIYTHL